MIPYMPKIGDTVRVSEFFMEITQITLEKNRQVAMGLVNIGDGKTMGVVVPFQAIEPFDAVKDAVSNDFNETD